MKKIMSKVLLAVLMVVVLAGCQEKSNEVVKSNGESAKKYKIAMVAAGVFGDQGMNDALLNGMEIFTEQTGIAVTSVEVSEFSDHAINARNFADQGYDLIVMGGPVSEVMPEIASQYPETHFLLNKGTISDMDNVTSVQFDEAGAAFLGGAFSVLMSEELNGVNKVGWVGGMRIPDLEKARYAFEAATQYVGGESIVVYTGSFTDIAKGKEIALQMYNNGASIVQAYAGAASNGVYQATESLGENYYAMGCATGQFHLSPEKIVASTVVKYDEFIADMLMEYAESNGTMESGMVLGGIPTNGTGIRYSNDIGNIIPQKILDEIQELEDKIIDGTIVVPTTEEEYNEFVSTMIK